MLLRTLGRLRLEGSDFTRPKPLLLLAYLALEGPKERRFLAELFWMNAADPLNRLSSALARLRKAAPGLFEADEVRVWTERMTDAQALLTAVEEDRYQEALNLYQGSFLEGVYLPDWSVELEEWVYKTREFIAGRVREALLSLAEKEAGHGEFQAATKLAERAWRLAGAAEPEPEQLGRLHTLLLAGSSLRMTEVREEAEGFDINLIGSPKEAREHLQKVSGVAADASPKLPTRSTSFVGRDLEITEIASMLATEDCRLISLLGPAGVGKTRLALQVAHEQQKLETFKDGVYFITLEALNTPNLIASSLADALAIPLQGQEIPVTQVAQAIAEQEMLLVLDNFEHLVDGAVQLAELLHGCPNLKLVITSRERLNLEEEQVFLVPSLPAPVTGVETVEEASHFDAVNLFVQRAKRARSDFVLTEADLPAVLRICRLVEGLPLGLELAAAWVRVIACEDIADELARNLDLLTTTTRDVPDRHRSLRSAFEYSWKLLSPIEQDVLRRLSVFRGGFRREAAADIAGSTIPVLVSLVDKSLLRVNPNGRYDSHPLLLQYAFEKLAEHPQEQVQAQDAHGRYFFSFLEHWGKELRGGKQKEALVAIEEEAGNVHTAWRWAIATERVDELKQSCDTIETLYVQRSRFRDCIELLDEAVKGLDSSNPHHNAALGRVLVSQGWLCFRLGDYQRGSELAEQGLFSLRNSGDTAGMMEGLNTLGSIFGRIGEYTKAKTYFEEALVMAKNEKDQRLTTRYLNNLGIVEKEVGNYQQAANYYREALHHNRQMKNHLSVARNLNNLGGLCLALGQLREAEALLVEGLGLSREMDFQQTIPHLLNSLAGVYIEQEKYAQSQALCHEGLEMAQKSGEKALEAEILRNLGRIALATKNQKEAQHYLEASLAAAWSMKGKMIMLATLVELACLWQAQGHSRKARDVLKLVAQHPAANQPTREQAQRLLNDLADELALTPKEYQASMLESLFPSLEEVVTQVLSPQLA